MRVRANSSHVWIICTRSSWVWLISTHDVRKNHHKRVFVIHVHICLFLGDAITRKIKDGWWCPCYSKHNLWPSLKNPPSGLERVVVKRNVYRWMNRQTDAGETPVTKAPLKFRKAFSVGGLRSPLVPVWTYRWPSGLGDPLNLSPSGILRSNSWPENSINTEYAYNNLLLGKKK